MDIRIATPSDLDDVTRLLAAQLAEHAIALDDGALRGAIRGPMEVPGRGAFLIARDGAPLGAAYVSYTWSLEHGGKSAWLEELYVVPSERSRGIGGRLLEAAIALARREGCAAVDLEVEEDHARAAHLYARAGFRPHRRARWVLAL
jgi:GNAT superfamily N-acetyltransferase